MTTDDPRAGDPLTDSAARGASWIRVALSVIALLVVAGAGVQVMRVISTPVGPSGLATVTIGARTFEGSTCSSVERGIEVSYGPDDLLFVRSVGPAELYEGQAVTVPGYDAVFVALPTDDGERWSQPATVSHHADGLRFEAVFDDGVPVVVSTSGQAGWCDGQNPNVFGR